MPAPTLGPDPKVWGPLLAPYHDEIDQRLANLEEPQSPVMMARMASTDLSTANAAAFAFRLVYLTDLNQLAYSNGAHWYKIALGALVV